LLASFIEIATPLKKFLAHGVNDIFEVKAAVLGVPIDERNMPHIEDIRFLLGVSWCTQWCTQEDLPIREHFSTSSHLDLMVFHNSQSSAIGVPGCTIGVLMS
jgi:hypothetical protein